MSRAGPSRTRDLVELILGYGMIVGIIWTPEHLQRILSPIALLLTLLVVLMRQPTRDELGLGWRGFIASLWILPAALALCALSMFVATKFGTLHPLYKTSPTSPATCSGPFTSSFSCRISSWTVCFAFCPGRTLL